jgi:hypothetical protein
LAGRLQRLVVVQQILSVERQTVAHRRWFSGLNMREGHRRVIGELFDAFGEACQQIAQRCQSQIKAVTDAQHVGVVLDIGAGRTQVDHAAANSGLLGVSANLSHQIMLNLRFNCLGALNIDLIDVGFQISDLFGSHQPRRLLRTCQFDPDFAPDAPFVDFAPDGTHGWGSIAPGER